MSVFCRLIRFSEIFSFNLTIYADSKISKKKKSKSCNLAHWKTLNFEHKAFYEINSSIQKFFFLESADLKIIYVKNCSIWIILSTFFSCPKMIQIERFSILKTYLLSQFDSFATFFKFCIISYNSLSRNGPNL